MDYRFKRDLKNSFMIIDAGFGDMGYEKDVLRYNDINVLVPFHTLDVNNVTQVWYDITGLVSLKDYLMQQGITISLIRKVLIYLKIAIDEVERYLIDINHLVLDVDMIYVVKNNNEWRLMFIYYPDNESTAALEDIMEFLMSNSDRKLMDFTIKLYDCACDGMNIDGLIRLIDEESDDINDEDNLLYEDLIKPPEEKAVEASVDVFPDDDFWADDKSFNEMMENGGSDKPSLLDKIKQYFSDYFNGKKDEIESKAKGLVPKVNHISKKKDKKSKKGYDELEDFVVEPDMQIYEPTVLLRPQDEHKSYADYELRYMGDNHNDNIQINKDEFLLGSAKEGNDSVIDSPVISRFHAKIVREGTAVYLEDLNSTNGTSVNGKLLGYKDRIRLNPDDEVMFADERYKVV